MLAQVHAPQQTHWLDSYWSVFPLSYSSSNFYSEILLWKIIENHRTSLRKIKYTQRGGLFPLNS